MGITLSLSLSYTPMHDGCFCCDFKSFIYTEHSFFFFIGEEMLKWIPPDELQAGQECVCVCLWPVACEKWRLWLGLEGAAEPWASLPHTHCFSFDAQFNICLLLDVLRVHVYSIWNYTEHTSWMSVRFIPWASAPPPPQSSQRGCGSRYTLR